ncbi:hypothetical protein BDV96DRAFT_684912 [Lophiotrema nucula]|uniref:F-box domain-containing protein n=1 Tax=Lophiotrema nucula TaxID=690887 RepID=A0A6A5ZG97_9PLEO|nr:hypothetical protein BDV96DRAFT_684912 [Lophiotrema nucula]
MSSIAKESKTSPISKLPNELLTIVLGYCFGDTFIDPDDILSIRQVCKGFEKCSHSIFVERLAETTFDIRSPNSIKNLVELSESELAESVKHLTFTCCVVPDGFMGKEGKPPSKEDLSIYGDVVEVELPRIREEEAGWCPSVYKWDPFGDYLRELGFVYPFGHASPPDEDRRRRVMFEQDKELDELTSNLSKAFKKFKNLEGTSFEAHPENDYVAPRWQKLYSNLPQHRQGEWQYCRRRYWGADRGLGILLVSLFLARVKPKHLKIPVRGEQLYGFWSYIAPAIYKHLCSELETLALCRHYADPVSILYLTPAGHDVLLTKNVFPKLRHLQVYRYQEKAKRNKDRFLDREHMLPAVKRVQESMPAPEHLAELSTITVSELGDDADLVDFLHAISNSPTCALNYLELVNCWYGPWSDILRTCGEELDLDVLAIHSDGMSSEEVAAHMNLPEMVNYEIDSSLLAKAAKVVELEPYVSDLNERREAFEAGINLDLQE